jgi:hypothetical protein
MSQVSVITSGKGTESWLGARVRLVLIIVLCTPTKAVSKTLALAPP